MSEQNVVPIMKPESVKKPIKPKIEPVLPASIVDVWRLIESSIVNGGPLYPEITLDSRDVLQSHLFAYIQQPGFMGLIARVGKRPVGVVLGHQASRPYGHPSRYAVIWNFWVEPSFRKKGVGQALWKEFSERMKRSGVGHFEAPAQSGVESALTRESGVPVSKLFSVIGGRF